MWWAPRLRGTCSVGSGGAGGTVLIYVGKGNNAGDALVAARALGEIAHTCHVPMDIKLRLTLDDPANLGELAQKKLSMLPPDRFPRLTALQARQIPARVGRLCVLDGLLGIGARGALRDPIRSAAREINDLRQQRGAYVYAIDTPTGLDAATGEAEPDAVIADETLTVGFAKTGLLADQAANHVGRLHVLTLPEFADGARQAPDAAARGTIITKASLTGLLPPRAHESNKGMYGRVGILAGSVGATGAAVMCSHACARAGAGLITLLTHPEIYPIVAAAAAPEIMVKPLASPQDALDMPFDVLALGPGLGQTGADKVRTLIERWPKPMVVDADGLNALAQDISPLTRAAGPRLLTPHPGEMQRLLEGDAAARGVLSEKHVSRADLVHRFTERYPVTLLLKGARTLIGERGRPPAYNTTGNAGMATGGMGDVLTGICAAFLGQKLSVFDAARLAAWLHGRAADRALLRAHESEQSLLPTNLFAQFGPGVHRTARRLTGSPFRLLRFLRGRSPFAANLAFRTLTGCGRSGGLCPGAGVLWIRG